MLIPHFLRLADTLKITNSIMASKPRFAEKAGAADPKVTVNAQREYFMLRNQLESQDKLEGKNSITTECINDAVNVA